MVKSERSELIHTGKKTCQTKVFGECLGYDSIKVFDINQSMSLKTCRVIVNCEIVYKNLPRLGTENWEDIRADIENGYLSRC